jgi:hypothetical protein
MSNQTNTPTQDEQSIQSAHFEILFGLVGRESTTVPQQIDKAHCNTSIDVQDKIIFFTGGDSLHGKRIIEEFSRRESIVDILFDQFNT